MIRKIGIKKSISILPKNLIPSITRSNSYLRLSNPVDRFFLNYGDEIQITSFIGGCITSLFILYSAQKKRIASQNKRLMPNTPISQSK